MQESKGGAFPFYKLGDRSWILLRENAPVEGICFAPTSRILLQLDARPKMKGWAKWVQQGLTTDSRKSVLTGVTWLQLAATSVESAY